MKDLPNLLFHKGDLHQTLQGNFELAKKEVNALSEQQFLAASDDEIVEHVFSKREVMPLALREDRMQHETRETEVDVRHDFQRAVFDPSRPCLVAGTHVTVSVPFEGDAWLWTCQPDRYTLNPPRAHVRTGHNDSGGHIEIVCEYPSDAIGDGTSIKREIDRTLANIKEYLVWSCHDVSAHNKQLRDHIRQYTVYRRQRLGKHAAIAKALNIPLKRDPGAPDLTPLPIKRKLVKPLPSVSNRPPEPGIREEDYSHILNVIRHEGRSFETTPRTFAKHDEEELRDIILAHLNGHYQGQATGESFRKSGKTDIRIEDQTRAAFIAECKVWRGEGELSKAVQQLLGYLTWRDCKGALIVFNIRNAKFSELQTKLPDAMRSHRFFLKETTGQQPGEWRFQMRSAEDADREVTVHVFLFDLYTQA